MIIDYEGVLHLDSGHQDPRTKDNKPSNFTTYPHEKLQFTSDDYEVGLHEIQLPQTYWNVPENQFVVAVNSSDGVVGVMRTLFAGCYYSISEITHRINELFAGEKGSPRLEYDSILKRVVSVPGMFKQKHVHLLVTRDLSMMLGFDCRYMSLTKVEGLSEEIHQYFSSQLYLIYKFFGDSVLAESPLCLNYMVPRIHVQCSIVKHRCHNTHHLLRTIPLDPNPQYGAIVTKTFDRPLFTPLNGRLIDHIEVKITDCNGKPVNFKAHTVVLTLEFRKRTNAFQ